MILVKNMISTQVNNVLCPKAYLINTHRVKGLHPLPPPVSFARCQPLKFPAPLKITTNALKCKQSMPVCMSSGQATAGSGNEDPLWKSFGKAIENLGKKPSVEDVLKQQIEKREYYDGGDPPGGGGGGSGGGGFGGLGGSDEEDSGLLHETVQVFLATVGFILIYLYIINGAEMIMLVRDYVKYVFGGKKSMRLARTFHMWKTILSNFRNKKENDTDKSWLAREIITTPTWWDSPEKYKLNLKAYVQKKLSRSNEGNDNQDDLDDMSRQSNL